MSFTEKEIAYMRSQPLVRIATVSDDGQPDAVATSFEFDGGYFYIGSISPTETRRVRNILSGQRRVALIIDDLASADPWTPRFVRVYGEGELIKRNGHLGPGDYLRIAPTVSWSWNLDAHSISTADDAAQATLRRSVHNHPA